MLTGALVTLTRFDISNAEKLRTWVNDPEVHRWMATGQRELTLEQELAFFESTERDWEEGSAYRFEIHAASDGRLLGVCGLEHADGYHRHAEVGLFIGEPQEWGQGFGGDAIRTLLRFAFEGLELHSVRICVYPENVRALELYRRIGFRETGRDREAWFISGGMRDLVRLDMLEDEYRARYSAE